MKALQSMTTGKVAGRNQITPKLTIKKDLAPVQVQYRIILGTGSLITFGKSMKYLFKILNRRQIGSTFPSQNSLLDSVQMTFIVVWSEYMTYLTKI